MSLVQDTFEKRKVAVFDIPGAFLQPSMPKDKGVVLVKLQGDTLVDLMCEVELEFKKTVIVENGKCTLYMECLQSIYGYM